MDALPWLLAGAGLLAFVMLRHAAMRRVAAGRGGWVWLAFAPSLAGGVVILWAAGTVLRTDPVFGILMAIGGVLYFASIVLMLQRVSRGVSAATSRDEIEAAVTDPMIDHTVLLVGVTLIGGLVLVVVLVVYGVTQAVN